ncbi:50S ribosomal subunit protein L20 [Candidatus Hodgkinia cicadicola]|nr:50S ribosomal subunit protein L20 [Candidatus Hodgkinia cicadicola]AUG91569.1 50S ribosomal subunit protein L20 [Candidatus Hodgkinia cicadicola]
MSRVSRGVSSHSRHKRVLSLAKGYRGRRKSCIRVAKQAVVRAMSNSYSSRRLRRRLLRRELILCLNHWSRCYSLCYKQLKFGLTKLKLCYSVGTLFNLLRSGLEYSLLMDLFLFCSLS